MILEYWKYLFNITFRQTPSVEGEYLTVYPLPCHNTDTVYISAALATSSMKAERHTWPFDWSRAAAVLTEKVSKRGKHRESWRLHAKQADVQDWKLLAYRLDWKTGNYHQEAVDLCKPYKNLSFWDENPIFVLNTCHKLPGPNWENKAIPGYLGEPKLQHNHYKGHYKGQKKNSGSRFVKDSLVNTHCTLNTLHCKLTTAHWKSNS